MKKVFKKEAIKIHSRYVKHNRDAAVSDIYDAIVEIVTNSDDSYRRLRKRGRSADAGDILIETFHRQNSPSLLVVRDKAEGMTLKAMREKLGEIGNRTSQSGDRGFMARGIKDCTALGDIQVESIVEKRYYACRLTRDVEIAWLTSEKGEQATETRRKALGIRKNGTVVTLECSETTRLPRPDNLKNDLSIHYALRDIAAGDGASKIHVRGGDGKQQTIEFRASLGKIVVDNRFTIDGYPKADCVCKIWKSPSPLVDKDSRMRKSGILVKDGSAIHECSLFGFGQEPLAHHYFGHIECRHLARLIEEHDARESAREPHPSENPFLPIDPMRRGLNKRHPFVKALTAKIDEILKALVEKDRRESESGRKNIASEKTKRFLNRLAQLADRFLKENVDPSGLSPREEAVIKTLLEVGIAILPPALKIAVGEERTLTVYIKKDRYNPKAKVRVQSVDESTLVLAQTLAGRILKPHPRKEGVVYESFKVGGVSPGETEIRVRHGNDLHVDVDVEVVAKRGDGDRDFVSPLEFDRAKYEVAEGKTKILQLFARIPDAIREKTTVYAASDSPSAPVLNGGKCVLSPVAGANYAMGEIEVKGRTLTDKPATISVRLGDFDAAAKISVRERRIIGGGLRIEFTRESLGDFRARWKDPVELSVILISSNHPSIKPYLGPSQNVEEQDTPQFRVLLAELVTDVLCSGILNQEIRQKPGGWERRDLPHEIFASWHYELQKKISKFSALAHQGLAGFFRE